MNNFLELCIEHKGARKLIILDTQLTFLEFKEELTKQFLLPNNQIKLLDINRNAEITSIL